MNNKRTPENERLLLQALELGLGFESAAPLLGVSTQTLRNWRNNDEAFAMTCQTSIAKGKVRVVGKLIELINKGNLGAICFWLKTRTEEFREVKEQPLTEGEVAAFREVVAEVVARRPKPPASHETNKEQSA